MAKGEAGASAKRESREKATNSSKKSYTNVDQYSKVLRVTKGEELLSESCPMGIIKTFTNPSPHSNEALAGLLL